MKKRFFAVLSLFSLLFASCGGTPYRNDLSAEKLCRECAGALAFSEIAFEGKEAFAGEDLPVGNPELSVCYSTNGNDLSEFGIWKTGGEKPRRVATFLADSLLERYQENEAFYQSYIPEELPKLRDAEVRVYGVYVAYAILSPDQKTAFFRFLEETLSKEKADSKSAFSSFYK